MYTYMNIQHMHNKHIWNISRIHSNKYNAHMLFHEEAVYEKQVKNSKNSYLNTLVGKAIEI